MNRHRKAQEAGREWALFGAVPHPAPATRSAVARQVPSSQDFVGCDRRIHWLSGFVKWELCHSRHLATAACGKGHQLSRALHSNGS